MPQSSLRRLAIDLGSRPLNSTSPEQGRRMCSGYTLTGLLRVQIQVARRNGTTYVSNDAHARQYDPNFLMDHNIGLRASPFRTSTPSRSTVIATSCDPGAWQVVVADTLFDSGRASRPPSPLTERREQSCCTSQLCLPTLASSAVSSYFPGGFTGHTPVAQGTFALKRWRVARSASGLRTLRSHRPRMWFPSDSILSRSCSSREAATEMVLSSLLVNYGLPLILI
ncbi:hypothetical protein BD310DRAFT_910143 [Dichomitus squalens]|uniref:Uncharacterized protein n=1 Tax=Dichomitus squalens TaxID=114155 RepID=A0A4Q9PE21_9APHY|nr:hypothetical protein BD310DRAFT_910143 [Dichomitus squalens]